MSRLRPSPGRAARALVLLVLAAAAPGASAGGWGSEPDGPDGAALLAAVRADLAAIVRAAPEERGAAIRALVEGRAADAIEALKRFRNPELVPLFRALLDHADWRVVHRALLALEHLDDGASLPRAWALLSHAEARMREKAAISCLRLWEAGGGRPGPGDPAAALAALREAEGDPHVRACLEALALRVARKGTVDRVAREVRVAGPDGLLWTPFLDGMDRVAAVAPGYVAKPVARTSGATAAKLPPARAWAMPLLKWGKEEVPGTGLQPFANPRQGGKVVHTGVDAGAYLDGAGFYACADGIVRMVHAGSDMGTLIVVEHRVTEKELATVLYMHAADVVFVKAGDRVAPRQLLGSMGIGFSIENGGHFAHLHFGAYPGAFSPTHNYGYKAAAAGLADWHDPAAVLPDWIDRTRPPVEDPGQVEPELRPAAASIRAGAYAAALAAARAVLGAPSSRSDALHDAERLVESLEGAAEALVARARAQRAKGHPSAARAMLVAHADLLAGLPGAEAPAREAAAWDADPAFRRDEKAEARFEAALATEADLLAERDAPKVRALWKDLLERWGDTALRARLEAKVRASGG